MKQKDISLKKLEDDEGLIEILSFALSALKLESSELNEEGLIEIFSFDLTLESSEWNEEGLIEIINFDLTLDSSEWNDVAVSKRSVVKITAFYRHDFGRLRNLVVDVLFTS